MPCLACVTIYSYCGCSSQTKIKHYLGEISVDSLIDTSMTFERVRDYMKGKYLKDTFMVSSAAGSMMQNETVKAYHFYPVFFAGIPGILYVQKLNHYPIDFSWSPELPYLMLAADSIAQIG